MATPNVGILTNAGKNLIDQVNAGKTKITFSKVVFSSMDNSQLSDMQVKALTAISPQEVVVSSPETTLDTNSGETRIRATGTNEKLADGVYVKTYGVFAKDDTGNEILYGVTVSPNPNYFPAYDGVTPQAVTYSYKTVIQETSNITMTNSNDVYASQEDLTEALQPYAKTVDVNQQLDKKVNIADMRKPASDVAGIEEVNAKQDKIGYTPADDAKVLHNSGLATIPTDNSGLVVGNNGDIGIIKQVKNSGFFAVGSTNTFHVVQSNNSAIGIADTFHDMFRINGSYQISLGSGSYFTPADDSKVAHLSGANNFDTVPTVNNNPLLLASSLPSDLARTGSDQEFTGKNTFDTAPIDKATGNPYITKDGVPTVDLSSYAKTSDVTTAISTATANMVDSSKPTNFTAGLKSGGVDVATAADLKSIEDSAWRPIISNNYSGLCMMKYNADTETMSLSGTIFPKTYSTEGSRVAVIIPLPDGFSMGENTNSKTNIWMDTNGGSAFSGVSVDLYFENDGIHIIFDKIYTSRQIFIILDEFFDSTASGNHGFINFKVTKN